MGRLDGKTALVTGGSKGIGRATCILMAREGAQVAVTDVVEDEGREVVQVITDAGGEAAYFHLDVSREDDVRTVFASVRERFGRIDVLVNNAGIAGVNKPTHECTVEEWEQVQAVNTRGVFLCTKHAVPVMQAQGGGSIVNLSSIYGIISSPDLPSYHASKGAVRLMTKTDALFYAGDGIRVNSVHPGFIWTPLVEGLAKSAGQDVDVFRRELDSRHPIGHVGEPDDIAWGIVYLASDEAKFLTGSELVIDGGYTAQ